MHKCNFTFYKMEGKIFLQKIMSRYSTEELQRVLDAIDKEYAKNNKDEQTTPLTAESITPAPTDEELKQHTISHYKNTVADHYRHKSLTPKKIYEYLDSYVVGQDEAKKIMATAGYNQVNRLLVALGDKKAALPKSNVLMIGESGSGKTYMVETLAKKLELPFISLDATKLATYGYKGLSLNDSILKLCDQYTDDDTLNFFREYGIVFIDEIDKLMLRNEDKMVGSLIESELLKLMEGEVITHSDSSVAPKQLDTKNLMFILSGSFSNNKKCVKHMGFNQEDEMLNSTDMGFQDVIDYGFMPEIAGRITDIVNLKPLEIGDFIQIIDNPHSVFFTYKDFFNKEGIVLNIEENAKIYLAKLIKDSDLGARPLNVILNNLFRNFMFDNDLTKIRSITIDVKSLKTNKISQIIYQKIPVLE